MTAGEPVFNVAIATGGVFPEAVGGSQRHTRLLVEHLARMPGIQLHLLHPHAKSLFAECPNVHEIHVKRVPSRIQYIFECYNYSKRIATAIEALPSDTVIYGQCTAVWAGIPRFRDRFVLNPHGLEPYQTLTTREWINYTPMRLAHNWMFRQSRHIVSLGGRLTGIIKRRAHPDAAIHVIPNAVDLPAVAQPKDFSGVCRLLFVGRHFANKGIPDLLAAMRLLSETPYRNKVRLDLVGDGPLMEPLRREFESPFIAFHGRQGDAFLEEKLREANLFVFPTLFEGMPTVVMEAMAHGTPIAVTDTGATMDLLDDEVGFLLEKHNPAQIAETIMRFIDLSEGKRSVMGAAARRKIEGRFTWPVVAQQHLNLFTRIAAKVPLVGPKLSGRFTVTEART